MNLRRLAGALVVLFLAATAISATLMTGASGSAKKKGPDLRFTLIGELDSAHVVDNDPSGTSPGDVLVFAQKLFDESRTDEVGSSRATCTRTTHARGDFLCSGAFLLGRNQITIQGVDPPATVMRHPLVVTGGSGRYRGVTGEITVHHVSPTEDRFHFRLRR